MIPALFASSVAALGAGFFAWAAAHPSAQVFGHTVRTTGRRNTVALTFDDGPNPAMTPRLLRLLEEHQVRATFFLIGRHVKKCGALAAEIVSCGHQVANHTHSHPNLAWCTRSRIREELSRCQEAIQNATGMTPQWFRPPFGFRGPYLDREVRAAGFHGVVMWSRMAKDWKPQRLPDMLRRLARVGSGDIVLLHDGSHHGLNANRTLMLRGLDFWLPRWRERAWEFVTVDEFASPLPAAPAEIAKQSEATAPAAENGVEERQEEKTTVA
jgi:peptidoglycan/xylan/chitin deacetylase (PgdA/CDA1 family)